MHPSELVAAISSADTGPGVASLLSDVCPAWGTNSPESGANQSRPCVDYSTTDRRIAQLAFPKSVLCCGSGRLTGSVRANPRPQMIKLTRDLAGLVATGWGEHQIFPNRSGSGPAAD